MKVHNTSKIITHALAVAWLMLASMPAIALGEVILQQSAQHITTGLYMVLGFIGVLLLTVFIQVFTHKQKTQKLAKAHAQFQHSQNSLPVGLVHLSLDGKVIYANAKACSLLGRLSDKLIGQHLAGCFSSEYEPQIEHAMHESNLDLKARARASNLYLSVKFSAIDTNTNEHYRLVCLCDENKLRREVEVSTKVIAEHQNMFKAMQLGQLWINLIEDSFTYNEKFEALLSFASSSSATDEATPLKIFTDAIHQADNTLWSKAVLLAKTNGHAQTCCRFKVSQNNDAHIYVGTHLSITATLNEKGECTRLHVVVRDNAEAEANKQLLETKIQQHQAMLSASNNPMYGLDESGNLLWSNSPFNMLLRRFMPNAKSKNLLELDFFPDAIKKLHQRPVGVSGRSYDMDFVLISPHDEGEINIKLNLMFYASKDRLTDSTTAGIIGIIQDTTELQLIKQQVKKHQSQLDNMLNLAPVAIATIDADDRIISANHVMSSRLSFSDTELKRQDFYQLFNDPSEAGKAAKKLHQTGHLRDYHAKLKGKDNRLHPSELHVDIIDKEKQEYLCWIADRSDEQFQQDKFDSLLQHSSMPMAILGEHGFSKLNSEACKFFCVNEDYDLFGVSPFSVRLNANEEIANALKQIVTEVTQSGKAKSFTWEHKVGDQILPCQATYVPMYKDQAFDSILCIWMDKRELLKADDARQLAINLHQAAQREVQEKQTLLASSQDQLATKIRTLADTEHKLQTVQEDLSETQSEFSYLQEAHRNVTDNLLQLKSDYGQSRTLLAQAQKVNTNLQSQLAASSEEVKGLNTQRSEIAAALKQSEENYNAAQDKLSISEENAEKLKHEQQTQHDKMQAFVEQITDMKQSVIDKDAQIGQVSEQINALQTQLTNSSNTTDKLREQLEEQREASEKAEQERRDIEHTCELAQAELRNKVRHLQHLESEMNKLEEMSNQEKGDMQAQQSALKLELEDKLEQLQNTQKALAAAQSAADIEKQEKAMQQALLEKVQQELVEVELTAQTKQAALAEKEQQQKQDQKNLQQKLWDELKAKQVKLQETELVLQQAKQQTESEKAEKEKHSQLLEQLKTELHDIESRNIEQQAKMAQTDEQWNQNKQVLKQEVEAKREQLAQTKQALTEIQRQADKERLARIEQEQKLAQLTLELVDVETRANKQKEMLAGSDEQWRKHHDEIEQQKQQLQQALQQAQTQNQTLQSQLEGKLNALQQAESQVSETLSGEQAVQHELNKTRHEAEELQSKITQQEQKEQQLQHQLASQQQALETKELSINDLKHKQKTLTQALAAVQEEYAKSKETLATQHDSHSHLSSQMSELEGALAQSKQALANKESALQAAEQALASSQSKLAEQETALLSAHKQELQQASEQLSNTDSRNPAIEKLPLPTKPTVWFDLLPYLQSQPQMASLPIALSELMDDLQSNIQRTESALDNNDTRELLASSRALVNLSETINCDALTYLMSSIQNDCNNGMVDNVSIRWPATKQGLEKTLRVVYSHLHA